MALAVFYYIISSDIISVFFLFRLTKYVMSTTKTMAGTDAPTTKSNARKILYITNPTNQIIKLIQSTPEVILTLLSKK